MSAFRVFSLSACLSIFFHHIISTLTTIFHCFFGVYLIPITTRISPHHPPLLSDITPAAVPPYSFGGSWHHSCYQITPSTIPRISFINPNSTTTVRYHPCYPSSPLLSNTTPAAASPYYFGGGWRHPYYDVALKFQLSRRKPYHNQRHYCYPT